MTTFSRFVGRHLDDAFALDPLLATGVGIHDHDARWPDLSAAGRAATLARLDGWTAELSAIDPADLAADEVIDRDRLLALFAAQRFELTELRSDAWDPLGWVYVLGDGLFGLLSREFAPAAERLASVAGRLEGIPAVLSAATSTLGSAPDVPVSRLHAERAIVDLPGIGSLIDEGLALAATLDASPASDALRARLEAAATIARAAIADFDGHLRDHVVPASSGEGRLGRERFVAKLAHTVGDSSLTLEHIAASARGQFVTVRAEMARQAALLWPSIRPDSPRPEDPDELIRIALDAVADDHPGAEELLDVCREALVRIEAFCRDHDVIGLSEEPLEIIWTPEFLRGWATAMLMSPGPFDTGQKTFFCVTPVPPDWTAELQRSYLRESNRSQLDTLTIHEAVPGHYLQGIYANGCPSIVRSVYGDGMYAEGWAVYVTQVMLDTGYRAGDPRFALAHWKYYLRAVVNTLLDIGIHTEDMGEDEALDLMIRGGFQERGEAVAKYRRARLTATQLCTYFVGSLGFWEIEHEARRRAAVRAAGADPAAADAVPTPVIVGGYGETPGFDRRAHLEAVIGGGQLPLPLLRRSILGDAG